MNIPKEASVTVITHTDTDGVFCGLIIKDMFPYARVYQTNYGKELDSNWLLGCNYLFVTDFSFDDLTTLRRLEDDKRFKLIWIDHHKICEDAEKAGFNPEGLRRQDVSAAYLTWEYLHPNEPVPKAIQLVSDYDVWKIEENPDCLLFQNHIRRLTLWPSEKRSVEYFRSIIKDESKLQRMISDGKRIQAYYVTQAILISRICCFETVFDGIKALAINMKNTNSTIFAPALETHPDVSLLILYSWYENIQKYRVSLYSIPGRGVMAHELAHRHGGGGHDGAAGFVADKLPFKLPVAEKPVGALAGDVYGSLQQLLKDPFLMQNAENGLNALVYSHNYVSELNGYSAVCVNNPVGLPQGFVRTGLGDNYQLGVYFYLMNNGWYSNRVYVLDPELDKTEVIKKFDSAEFSADGTYFLYNTKTPPERKTHG